MICWARLRQTRTYLPSWNQPFLPIEQIIRGTAVAISTTYPLPSYHTNARAPVGTRYCAMASATCHLPLLVVISRLSNSTLQGTRSRPAPPASFSYEYNITHDSGFAPLQLGNSYLKNRPPMIGIARVRERALVSNTSKKRVIQRKISSRIRPRVRKIKPCSTQDFVHTVDVGL